MKPQSCKAKGRRLQQMIVRDLLERFPELTEDDVRSTSMGAGGEDVQLSAAARRSVPFSFEAKNQERLNLWSALDQAHANSPDGIESAVVIKKNNVKPHVLISWECFLNLIAPATVASAQLTPRENLERISNELQCIARSM